MQKTSCALLLLYKQTLGDELPSDDLIRCKPPLLLSKPLEKPLEKPPLLDETPKELLEKPSLLATELIKKTPTKLLKKPPRELSKPPPLL
tara:strand:- start:132 stop:401 length:270 start_codon:yes stop_codon:yes gene_type:complete